jgi:hypothetical protein
MIMAQGLGDADRQTLRDEKGDHGVGARMTASWFGYDLPNTKLRRD